MQQNTVWERKAKLKTLLALKENISIEEKERASWFLTELQKLQSACQKKSEKTMMHINALRESSKNPGTLEINYYFQGIQRKYDCLQKICKLIDEQKNILSKLIVA